MSWRRGFGRDGLTMAVAATCALAVFAACEEKTPEPTPASPAAAASATARGSVAPPGGSGASPSADAATCREAANRHATCMEELLGKEAGALAKKSKGDGVGACASEPKTVAMYRKCLTKKDCAGFQACLKTEAKAADPRHPAVE